MKKIAWFIFFLFGIESLLFADIVVLRDGRELHGTVVEDEKHSGEIKMDVFYVRQAIPRSNILSIQKEGKMTTVPSLKKGVPSSEGPVPPLSITPEQVKEIQKKHLSPKETPQTSPKE